MPNRFTASSREGLTSTPTYAVGCSYDPPGAQAGDGKDEAGGQRRDGTKPQHAQAARRAVPLASGRPFEPGGVAIKIGSGRGGGARLRSRGPCGLYAGQSAKLDIGRSFHLVGTLGARGFAGRSRQDLLQLPLPARDPRIDRVDRGIHHASYLGSAVPLVQGKVQRGARRIVERPHGIHHLARERGGLGSGIARGQMLGAVRLVKRGATLRDAALSMSLHTLAPRGQAMPCDARRR